MNIRIIRNITNIILLLLVPLLQSCAVDQSEVLPKRIASYESKGEYTPWNNQYEVLYKSLGKQAKVNKPINLCDRDDVLYVKMHNHSDLNSDEFMDVVMSTLEENTFFKEVVTRKPTIYINAEPEMQEELPDERFWWDTDDPQTIGDIKRLYPDKKLMILEVRMQEIGDDSLSVTMSLIDPLSNSTIVLWHNSRSVWYIVGHTPTRGMMQDFNQWMAAVDEICECQCLK